jgi:hypothetical protein
VSSDAPDEDAERARMHALLGALQKAVSDARAPDEIRRDPRAWLAGAGVLGADLDAMAGLDPRRLLLYRKHVRRGLADSLKRQLPRSAARLGPAWEATLDRFFNEELSQSHYLRDVAFELVAFAAPLWAADPSLPSYITDLARHELVAFEVQGDPGTAEPTGLPLDLDRPARFHPAVRLRRYDHAIHRIEADLEARDLPPRKPTALLAYRDAEHDVRYLELTPLAAGVIERLLPPDPGPSRALFEPGARAPVGQTLRAAVTSACAELGFPTDGSVLASIASVLGDLSERGVLLGAEPL